MSRAVLSAVFLIALSPPPPAQSPVFRVLDHPLPATMPMPDAVGDLDNDGAPEFVTSAGIYSNDGHATFSSVPGPALAFQRQDAAIADVNGDGLRDFLSITPLLVLQVHLNGGGLAFFPFPGAIPPLGVLPPAGAALVPWAVTPGDVDGDGDTDLVVRTRAPLPSYVPAPPLLLLNGGSGLYTVAAAVSFPVAGFATIHEELADFDGDGDPDLVLVGSTAGSITFEVRVATNLGSGAFAAPALTGTWPTIPAARSGDFNGDAIPDLAIAGFTGSPVCSIQFGAPTGLGPAVFSPLPLPANWLIAADLDADGRSEILAGNGSGSTFGVVAVLPGGTASGFTQSFAGVAFSQYAPGPDVVADLDLDGDRDLILPAGVGPALFMNGGQGALVLLTGRLPGPGLGATPLAGDIDGDSDPDLVTVSSSNALATLLNDGSGFFAAGPASTVFGPTNAAYLNLHAFDREGDGDMDLYAARNMLSTFGIVGNDLVLDNAGGTFTVAAVLPDHAPVTVIRDLDADGDGDRDILLGRRAATTVGTGLTSPMLLLVNTGSGSFAPAAAVGANHATYDVEIADFDGNGSSDIFQTNAVPGTGTDPCVLYLNNGAGSFAAFAQPAMSGFYSCAGDVDGNGSVDLVLDGQVWFGTGGAAFAPGPPLVSPLGQPATLLDVDEDGDLDLVETPATVMPNAGGGSFGPRNSEFPFFWVAPTSWTVPESVAIDLDRDGDLDLAGGDGRIHMNCRRQIAIGARPRPGRPASLALFGPPGASWLLFASLGTAVFPLPPFGTLLIDPATAALVTGGSFAPAASPAPGTAALLAFVPPDPALVGYTLHWQMADGTQRLSNRDTTTILAY